ncbi:MAG: hypothetical protein JWN92_903 [Candidatus Acidoferrum typicum]|nr:hypothetical protein [Candidatus Acidoferrum typicum]
MPPLGTYEKDWAEFRRCNNVCLLVFLGYLPVVGSVAFLSEMLFHSHRAFFVAFLLYGIIFVWASVRVRLLKCPRCRKVFSFYSPLGRRCVHCGLSRYSA